MGAVILMSALGNMLDLEVEVWESYCWTHLLSFILGTHTVMASWLIMGL